MCDCGIKTVGLMFISQKQTTYMFPSVPSEEREWTSVMIPATPVAPERQATPSRGGRSTALLQEGIIITPRWGFDEDRGETLNETRIQIPQVMHRSEEAN